MARVGDTRDKSKKHFSSYSVIKIDVQARKIFKYLYCIGLGLNVQYPKMR